MSSQAAHPRPLSETTRNPQPAPDKLASTLRIDTPLQHPAAPTNPRTRDEITSDLAILSLLLRSNRVSVKEFMAYYKLQHMRLSVATTSNNINFRLTVSTPAAVQEVFNTAELLEMILPALPTGYLYARAQLACRGFKNDIEASPEFQRRMAVATRGFSLRPSFAWSVAPKCMHFHYAVDGRAVFRFTFTDLSFERHLNNERFRRLAVSNTTPQRIEVLWYEGEDFNEHREFEGALWRRMIWISSMSALGKRDGRVPFGSVFDVVARRVPVGRRVGGMMLFLTVGGEADGGPFFADRELRNVRARSA